MTFSGIQNIDFQNPQVISKTISAQGIDFDGTEICRAIIAGLVTAVVQDLQNMIKEIDANELGWRNKYNIHLLSGVSQKKIYQECGVIENLVNQGIIERRPSPSKWGKQKHQYRIGVVHLLT